MNHFYTSDLHIGHRLVAGLRGFDSTEEHDATLAAYWDLTVKPEDTVFVLGDTGMTKFEQVVLPWFSERPGSIHLIAGNHDPIHPARSDAYKLQSKWLSVFSSVQPYATRKTNGVKFLMSHFPYLSWGEGPLRGGEEAARWVEWRLPESDVPLLHGHTHGPEKAHGQMLHVGWDAWGRFVREDEVVAWVQSLN